MKSTGVLHRVGEWGYGVMRIGGWLTVAWVCVAALGCDGERSESLEEFQQRWHAAVNTREADPLYDMLDSSSQWVIRSDLEKLRGLSEPTQRVVLDQLGGVFLKSLSELTPRRYFALLWHKATEGNRPLMALEASGPESAYMILKIDEEHRLRIRLVLEGGRWTWRLPKQNLGQFQPIADDDPVGDGAEDQPAPTTGP